MLKFRLPDLARGRGMAMWTMSKVVMLIFLFTVMGSVLYYQAWVDQLNRADQAGSVASTVVRGFERVMLPDSLESTTFVPVPYKIAGSRYYLRVSYSNVGDSKVLYVVVASGSHDSSFNGPWDSAASVLVSKDVLLLNGDGDDLASGPVNADSYKHRFIMISKSFNKAGVMTVMIKPCERVSDSGECQP